MPRTETNTLTSAERLTAAEADLASAEQAHAGIVSRMADLRAERTASNTLVMSHRNLVSTLREQAAAEALDAQTPATTLAALEQARQAAAVLERDYDRLMATAAATSSVWEATADDRQRAAQMTAQAEQAWADLVGVRMEIERLDASRIPPVPPAADAPPSIAQVIAAALSPRRQGLLTRLFTRASA